MDLAQKRAFSTAFGVISNVLNSCQKQEKLGEADDEEYVIIVSQFTAL